MTTYRARSSSRGGRSPTPSSSSAAAAPADAAARSRSPAAAPLRCRKCGYPWLPRSSPQAPTPQCAHCGSPDWDAPGKDGTFPKSGSSTAFSSIKEAIEWYIDSGGDAA